MKTWKIVTLIVTGVVMVLVVGGLAWATIGPCNVFAVHSTFYAWAKIFKGLDLGDVSGLSTEQAADLAVSRVADLHFKFNQIDAPICLQASRQVIDQGFELTFKNLSGIKNLPQVADLYMEPLGNSLKIMNQGLDEAARITACAPFCQ